MTFERQPHDHWHDQVPGARWFKADLHIHTMDDLAGRQVKMPAEVIGDPQASDTITAYARCFLRSAAERGVQVLGVTPHSPRVGTVAEASAVWRIVEEWNSGLDDDNVPFRKKIYAVFPGFEPSLNDGRSGLHLLFMFDPEIGLSDYLKAFDLIMGGVSPWPNKPDNQLRMSNKSAEEAFGDLREFHWRECPKTKDGNFQWSYITLAPHIDDKKGLLGAQRAQVLENFSHDEIAGLELGDAKMPEDVLKNRPKLAEGMAKRRQAFFHGSDACKVSEIGKRHTWLKLASPRIEALRQALIASDSRVRIGYERGADGELSEVTNPPDVTMNKRPWLKSVTVSGRASFFGAEGDGNTGTRFDLSPDLTCVIGGSMTGKSTFLDGLRIHVGAPLPQQASVKDQVEARGRTRFLGGSPIVEMVCPGRDTTATLHDQWPAEFYTQSELQRLVRNSDAVEDILARLVEFETQPIESRERRLQECDNELSRAAIHFAKIAEDLADAEQAFRRSQTAAAELAAFSDAGVENLNKVSSDLLRWRGSAQSSSELARDIDRLLNAAGNVDIPQINDDLQGALPASAVAEGLSLPARWDQLRELLNSAKVELGSINNQIRSVADSLAVYEEAVRTEVDRKLAERGLDGSRISQLQALNIQASLLESYRANLNEVRDAHIAADRSFESLLAERQGIVREQRAAFDRVVAAVQSQFDGRIIARRIDDGRKESLDRFLKQFSQRGVTRWWNDLTDLQRPTPKELLEKLDSGRLEDVGMSEAVQATFKEQLIPSKRRELAAIRTLDQYVLEFRMADGSYRLMQNLSGGQRVNLLLSLLLETNDERPLVIDQPEDELDNRFLFGSLLPALKRLKGRRQIILATHNANIVVNGDADQVIQLEATADRGLIACTGAIEDPRVRDAIVQTVDGGDEAFRLRRLKYGF